MARTVFTLEALDAKHGDALLLHYGKPSNPKLIIIDGGPAGVYAGRLRPRLKQLQNERSPGQALRVEIVMVSHIDDDHINGVVELFAELLQSQQSNQTLLADIQTLWHNSFEELSGADPADLSLPPKGVSAVALGHSAPARLPLTRRGALILLSVTQGRQLRDQARALGLGVPGLMTYKGGAARKVSGVATGLDLRVIGPNEKRVAKLKEEWTKAMKKRPRLKPADFQVVAADFVDNSFANLSSLVVIARQGKRSMLLTGDARGDDILAALTQAKMLKSGRIHVDLLKVPHHGSERNVKTDFFRKVTADHYVISADGRFGNPEVATLKMIAEARGNDEYTVHLTNSIPRVTAFAGKLKSAGKKAVYRVRNSQDPSLRVDLEEPLP